MRKPNKRAYPDYYSIIHNPIALEDIKQSIENGTYPTLQHIRAAFELCFNNCIDYNQNTSDIYRDAKDLKVCSA